jgi:hypothetical protein
MTDDLVKRLRHVFDDTYEVTKWIDDSTYEGAELFTHVVGMFETMLAAADRIEKLESVMKDDARWLAAYHKWREMNGCAPSSSDLIAAREALEGKDE